MHRENWNIFGLFLVDWVPYPRRKRLARLLVNAVTAFAHQASLL